MASENKYSLILASRSPRRKELLGYLDIPFEIHSEDIEEVSNFEKPFEVAEHIAEQKGIAVYKTLSERKEFGDTWFPLIIFSDTIVCLDGKMYGKPEGVDGAREMLLELAGKTTKW